jgi:hypothetical protein
VTPECPLLGFVSTDISAQLSKASERTIHFTLGEDQPSTLHLRGPGGGDAPLDSGAPT